MSIQELVEMDTVKNKWKEFNGIKDAIDSSFGQLRAIITGLEEDQLFIDNASEEELAVITKYKELVNVQD